jgi:hypothetical protein
MEIPSDCDAEVAITGRKPADHNSLDFLGESCSDGGKRDS